MEDYQGGRDLEDLQTFAKENLGPSCGPQQPRPLRRGGQEDHL
jgi:hypothetical protein